MMLLINIPIVYENNVISFKLAGCGSMETEPLLDILPISQHHGGGRYGKVMVRYMELAAEVVLEPPPPI